MPTTAVETREYVAARLTAQIARIDEQITTLTCERMQLLNQIEELH